MTPSIMFIKWKKCSGKLMRITLSKAQAASDKEQATSDTRHKRQGIYKASSDKRQATRHLHSVKRQASSDKAQATRHLQSTRHKRQDYRAKVLIPNFNADCR